MNWSIYNASRGTHIKIVVVGLTAAILLGIIGLSAATLNLGTDILTARGPTVIKAGAPVAVSERNQPKIR